MSIKIQVKDNRGCNSTFTSPNGLFANSAIYGAPFGVTPITQRGMDRTNAFMQPCNGFGFEFPMTTSTMRGIDTMWQGGLQARSVQNVINRIALVDPILAQTTQRLATIDPIFVANLASVAGGCAWTAAQIAKLATVDRIAARTALQIAIADPHRALSMIANQLGDPTIMAGRANLNNFAGFGIAGNDFPYANAVEVPVAIADNGGEYVLEADLPGVSMDDIELTATNGVLEIEAITKRSFSATQANGSRFRQQVGGIWRRSFSLGSDIEVNEISARIVNGVLTVVLPKKLGVCGETLMNREASLVC